jgi:protein-arginine deiminase
LALLTLNFGNHTWSLELIGDSNRDGKLVAEEDTEFSNEWKFTHGALVLFNCDDDDEDGVRDFEDEVVNGPADLEDLAKFELDFGEYTGEEHVVQLSPKGEQDPYFRVFYLDLDGEYKPLDLSEEIWTVPFELREKGSLELRVEAKQFTNMKWSGYMLLRTRAGVGEDFKDAAHVMMRVAPWIMLSNAAQGDELYVRAFEGRNEAFIEGLKDYTEAASATLTVIPAGNPPYPSYEIWLQDALEIGYTEMPGKRMNVVLNSNRNKGLDMAGRDFMLGPDFGWFTKGEYRETYGKGEGGDSWIDWFGNLEITPPLATAPLGRPYFGRNFSGHAEAQLNPEVVDMIKAQAVMKTPLAMDVGWLLIKHVDEIVCFVPSGDEEHPWKVLVPNTQVFLDHLSRWSAEGKGDAPILTIFKDDMTVDKLAADKPLVEYNLRLQSEYINKNNELMKKEFGLRDEDFIHVPAWYEKDGRSMVPNMVNSVVLNGHLGVPQPNGPVVDDKDLLEEAFRKQLSALPLEVHFLDDRQYHKWCGNVHCATNVKRDPGAKPWWSYFQP